MDVRVPTEMEAIAAIDPEQKLNLRAFKDEMVNAIKRSDDSSMSKTNFVFKSVLEECKRVGVAVEEELQILACNDFELMVKCIIDGQSSVKMKPKGEIF